MKASTTVHKMLLTGKKLFVPSYLRASSWETPSESKKIKLKSKCII